MGVGDDFLAKRYAAGREEGRGEGIEIGNDQVLKLMEENPGATVDQIRELLRNGDKPRQGKGGGAVGED